MPAYGPTLPQDSEYLVEEIRDGLNWVTECAYQIMFLTTGEGVLVVDAPLPPIPTVTFTEGYELTVGNQTLILDYRGANHEPGNIFIYAPRQKALMLVDVVFPGWVPFKDLALAEDIRGLLAAHDRVLEYDFDDYIESHLTRWGTRKDVEIQKEYFGDSATNAGMAPQSADFMAIAQEQGFGNLWNRFGVYLDAVAEKTADPTLQKWQGQLGAADVGTKDHRFRILEGLRIK